MNRLNRQKIPDFEVEVIQLSPERILELQYENYAKTFRIENFKYNHRLLERVYTYGSNSKEVETIEVLEGKEYILKIGKNIYGTGANNINWWGTNTFDLDLKSRRFSGEEVSTEFVKYPHLYMEFLRVTLPVPLPPPLTPAIFSELIANCAIQVGYLNLASTVGFSANDISFSDNPVTILVPVRDFHFKESHFKMYAMKPYLEVIILEEIYHLTKKYLTLNEPIKCDC